MTRVSLEETGRLQARLQKCLNLVVRGIGPIQIGRPQQFPEGWGRAAKGRTVWRIVEEAVVQNVKARADELGLVKAESCPGEVDLYDLLVQFRGSPTELFVNVKTAAAERAAQKDDVSKAEKIIDFFWEGRTRQLFIAKVVVSFSAGMLVGLERCLVAPMCWLPEIYVNSRNHNLQCCQPKNPQGCKRRTNVAFLKELRSALRKARGRRAREARGRRRG